MIPLSKKPNMVSADGNTGVFAVEALYPGYGATVGNAMRRVLLSSLAGSAITRVKIKNAPHEFATMPGVLEDALMILLNLKRLRFRMYGDSPQTGELKVKGERNVTAGDFTFPSQVELVNPEAPIATLTSKDASLEMEVQIETGTGYVPASSHKKGKEEIGSIALDAMYTPIEKVSFRVEQMRVGERTDFDRLTIEIETDGTMSPRRAFMLAAEILVNQFSLLADGMREHVEAESAEEQEKSLEKEKPAKKKPARNASQAKRNDAGGPAKKATSKKS